VFFSEEKNQRLLILPCFSLSGHGLDLSASARSKSLLVLFFRKEHLLEVTQSAALESKGLA
jgi:hypothetical protein